MVLEVESTNGMMMNMTVGAYFEPFLFFLCQHVLLDHSGLDGHTSETFESQPDVTVEFAFGLDSLHSKGRFNSHAPLPLEIYAKGTQLMMHTMNRTYTHKNQARW